MRNEHKELPVKSFCVFTLELGDGLFDENDKYNSLYRRMKAAEVVSFIDNEINLRI